MTSFYEFQRLDSIIKEAANMGFKVRRGEHGSGTAIVPLDDAFPTFARDTDLFSGDLESIQTFLSGVRMYNTYMRSIGITDEMICKKEELYRQRRLISDLKSSTKE